MNNKKYSEIARGYLQQVEDVKGESKNSIRHRKAFLKLLDEQLISLMNDRYNKDSGTFSYDKGNNYLHYIAGKKNPLLIKPVVKQLSINSIYLLLEKNCLCKSPMDIAWERENYEAITIFLKKINCCQVQIMEMSDDDRCGKNVNEALILCSQAILDARILATEKGNDKMIKYLDKLKKPKVNLEYMIRDKVRSSMRSKVRSSMRNKVHLNHEKDVENDNQEIHSRKNKLQVQHSNNMNEDYMNGYKANQYDDSKITRYIGKIRNSMRKKAGKDLAMNHEKDVENNNQEIHSRKNKLQVQHSNNMNEDYMNGYKANQYNNLSNINETLNKKKNNDDSAQHGPKSNIEIEANSIVPVANLIDLDSHG